MTCALLAVARDEDRFLDEWINYHLNLGFDHIYICDNNDYDKRILMENKKITVYPYHNIDFSDDFTKHQNECYDVHLDKIWDKYDYCAIIDIDEFFEFKDCKNVKEFIQKHMIDCNYTVAEIPWEVYTDNNLILSPNCNVQKAYTQICQKLPFSWLNNINSWGKSIFKLNKGIKTTPHWPEPKSMPIFKSNHVSKDIAVVKHYRTKSLEDFLSHKVKNQAFGSSPQANGGSVIESYFIINDITIEKILYILDYYHNNNCHFNSIDKQFIKDCFDKLGFITVVVRTHNRLHLLKNCIKYLETQFKTPNILILDDASDLDTFKWCSTKNIHYMRTDKNAGSSKMLMMGRHMIQTPYYIILDDDDYWTNLNVIGDFYDLILNNPGYDIYGDNYLHVGNLVKTDLLLKCPLVPVSGLGEDWYFSWIKNNGKMCPVGKSFNFYHYENDHDNQQLSKISLNNELSGILRNYYNQEKYPHIMSVINEQYYNFNYEERKILDQIKKYIIENNLLDD